MKLLVCGGRDLLDHEWVFAELDALHAATPVTLLIHGGAWGVDSIAGNWAIARKVPYKVFAALWQQYGRSAGAERNQRMLDESKPDLVVAFPGGVGTADMVKRTKVAKVALRVVAPTKSA